MNSKYQLPKDGGLIKESAPKDIVHRYERMPTRVFESEYDGVQYVADVICRLVRNHVDNASARDIYEELPPFVLGLTTGRTPIGLYRELVRRYRAGDISFKSVAVYSLDEFYPIRRTEQQSRNFRIHDEFLKHIDIQPENVHIPDGSVAEKDVSEYCANFDKSIRKIDLMIIGFGE
ncbi:MAG: 6-phosphogluconolactonase, partial [Alistipes sp.]|nr:6-phosphogluconolactonase [Alistipes sp.]